MRTSLLSILLISIAFGACKKNTPADTTTPAKDSMVYVINGLTDVTLKNKDSVLMPIAITRTSGPQEKLTLSVSGLPANATYSFSVASGIPDFTSVLTLFTNYAAPGNYDIQLSGTTASGKTNNYSLKMNVLSGPPPDCAEKVTGTYNSTYTGSVVGAGNVTMESTSKKYEIKYVGFSLGTIYGDLDCNLNTVTIKSQEVSPYNYVSGSGTFTNTTTTLNLITKNPSGTQTGAFTCVMTR